MSILVYILNILLTCLCIGIYLSDNIDVSILVYILKIILTCLCMGMCLSDDK